MVLTSGSGAQFLSVLIIFVLVLGVTMWVTRWMANYQKAQNCHSNIEVLETVRITANKYIQLVRVGQTYKVIAVCKDTVTLLGEVPGEQLVFRDAGQGGAGFREILQRTLKKDSGDQSE